PIPADRINELVETLNRKAGEFLRQVEILEAIAVFDRIIKKKNTEGETPALTRAIAAQTKIVDDFTAVPGEVDNPPAKPGLQLARRPTRGGDGAKQPGRRRGEWMAEYHSELRELIEAVETVG